MQIGTLRAGVVGTGHLGSLHARKYQQITEVALTAVADADPDRAREAAGDADTRICANHRELAEHVDIASIAVPTGLHYEIARDLIKAGVHVLVEKPLTTTVDEARELVELARDRGVVLQVGHLERFNPAVEALVEQVEVPLFIESQRVAPFNIRGTDVNVVLDLMIHDIDLILQLVDAPLTEVRANGVPVLTEGTDIANARLAFANGCVANLTASRVSLKRERCMRIFQRDTYLSVDMADQKLQIRRRGDGELYPGVPEIESKDLVLPRGDALQAEIHAFADAVRRGQRPVVSGEDGLRALEAATEIMRQLDNQTLPGSGEHTDRQTRQAP